MTSFKTYRLECSDTVRLPIGVRKDGQTHRTVVIDEMIGIDEENMANPKFKKNPVRAITALLQRCIQEIPGVVPRKKKPTDLLDEKIVQALGIADRDVLFASIRALSFGTKVKLDWRCEKSDCGADNVDDLDLSEVDVHEWPDEEDPSIRFELPKGVEIDGAVRRSGRLRLPTVMDGELGAGMAETDPGGAGTSMLTALIVDLDGVRPDRTTVQRMRTRDRKHLSDAVERSAPGIRGVRLTCAKCGKESEEVPLNVLGFFSDTSQT